VGGREWLVVQLLGRELRYTGVFAHWEGLVEGPSKGDKVSGVRRSRSCLVGDS